MWRLNIRYNVNCFSLRENGDYIMELLKTKTKSKKQNPNMNLIVAVCTLKAWSNIFRLRVTVVALKGTTELFLIHGELLSFSICASIWTNKACQALWRVFIAMTDVFISVVLHPTQGPMLRKIIFENKTVLIICFLLMLLAPVFRNTLVEISSSVWK